MKRGSCWPTAFRRARNRQFADSTRCAAPCLLVEIRFAGVHTSRPRARGLEGFVRHRRDVAGLASKLAGGGAVISSMPCSMLPNKCGPSPWYPSPTDARRPTRPFDFQAWFGTQWATPAISRARTILPAYVQCLDRMLF